MPDDEIKRSIVHNRSHYELNLFPIIFMMNKIKWENAKKVWFSRDKYSMGLYVIKSGRVEMQIRDIQNLLEQTYGANMHDIETIKKSIEHCLSYGAFV